MTPSTLPDRPNLEQLKKQAKSLLYAAKAQDPAALQRFASLPAFARKSGTELSALDLALHDAQSVIAREHGFASWNALREKWNRERCPSMPRSTSSSAAPPVERRAVLNGCWRGIRRSRRHRSTRH